MDRDFLTLVDDGLRALWDYDPIAATFAGEPGWATQLPRADAAAESEALQRHAALDGRLAAMPVPDDPAARLDARHLHAFCAAATSPYARRARYCNPAWYTGEAAFGIISLLSASGDAGSVGDTTVLVTALDARLAALPEFLDAGRTALNGIAIPAAWALRARTEIRALQRLLRDGLPLHSLATTVDERRVAAVLAACDRFAETFGGGRSASATPDSSGACGAAHLAFILRTVHGLSETPAELERRAARAFDAAFDALTTLARQRDPSRSWREQLAALADEGPLPQDVLHTYEHWHDRALRDAAHLVTPAADYGLTFALLPDWARPVASDLYFLFYRSPAARRAGSGSTYWVAPPLGSPAEIRRTHNTAAVKLVHAVHHGSVGHHTQNARARAAQSRFARIAGTDGASGLTLLAAGTLVEGWACYAEDLLSDVTDFYSAAESLQLAYFELRNIASCLADLRFHTGTYTLEEMRAFYRDEAHFAPARIDAETTRNSMFPGSRVMYWCGTQQIAALRRTSTLSAKAFHDELLAFGSAPVAWIAEEMAR